MSFDISMSKDEGNIVILGDNEFIINLKDLKNCTKKGNEKMSNKHVPTKSSYESAMETVKQYEKRQAELKYVQKELSFKLSQFTQVKFKIDKNNGEIIFAGVHKKTNKLLLTKTVCSKQDVFNENIGKLICVKKVLQEDIGDIVNLVENNCYKFEVNTFYTKEKITGSNIWFDTLDSIITKF